MNGITRSGYEAYVAERTVRGPDSIFVFVRRIIIPPFEEEVLIRPNEG